MISYYRQMVVQSGFNPKTQLIDLSDVGLFSILRASNHFKLLS